jgi:hypothetical protein
VWRIGRGAVVCRETVKDLCQELIDLTAVLDARRLDYGLCGGIAVAIHGYARYTKDIGLVVRRDNLDECLDAARSRGFLVEGGLMRFEIGTPREQQIFRISKVEGEELLTLDMILVGPLLEDVWRGRKHIELRNSRIVVVSLQGLETMKRAAGRDQDMLNLKKLGLIHDSESGQS